MRAIALKLSKGVRMRILVFATITLCAVLPSDAASGAREFQVALELEKGAGNLEAAASGYQAVLEQYRAGRVDRDVALRARSRLDRLRRVHNVESVLGGRETEELSAPVNPRLLSLREAFGMMGVPDGLRLAAPNEGSEAPVGGLARRIQAIGESGGMGDAERGLGVAPAIVLPSAGWSRRSGRMEPAWRLARAINATFRRLQHTRPASPIQLYQAGLARERAVGDLSAAVQLYREALEGADPGLSTRIRHRLEVCLERLRPKASARR